MSWKATGDWIIRRGKVLGAVSVIVGFLGGTVALFGGSLIPWTTAAQGQAFAQSNLEQDLRLDEMERDRLYPLIWDMEDRERAGMLSEEDRLQLQRLRDRLRALNVSIEAMQASLRGLVR